MIMKNFYVYIRISIIMYLHSALGMRISVKKFILTRIFPINIEFMFFSQLDKFHDKIINLRGAGHG